MNDLHTTPREGQGFIIGAATHAALAAAGVTSLRNTQALLDAMERALVAKQ